MKNQSVTLALFETERVVAPAPVAVPTIEPDADLEPGDEEDVLELERLRDVDAIAAQLVGEFARIEREDVAHATESRIVSELRPLMRRLVEARAQYGHEDDDGELDGEPASACARGRVAGGDVVSHGLSKDDKARIVEITVAIVSSMVAKGEVDPEDDDALRAATKQASEDARAAYVAAMEYVSG